MECGEEHPDVSLFEGFARGSRRVLAQTKALAPTQGLTMKYLPEQRDLDTLEDFDHWRESLG